jgi:hypothetical protein
MRANRLLRRAGLLVALAAAVTALIIAVVPFRGLAFARLAGRPGQPEPATASASAST